MSEGTVRNGLLRLLGSCLVLSMLFYTSLAGALTATEVYRAASPSVVVVTTWRGGVELAQGSGVVVAPGRIVTNAHVIAKGESILIESEGGETWQADWGYVDSYHDLAVLIVPDLPLAPLELATELPEIGETVYALGAPQGLGLTLSDGIVSGIRDTDQGTLIQMSSPISSGSSGGALLDSEGRLVGVPSMRALHGEALNFAVPAARVGEALAGVDETERPEEVVPAALPAAEGETPPLIGGRYYVVGANENGVILLDPEQISVDGDTITFSMVLRSRWDGDGGRRGYGKEARYRSMLDCAEMREAVLSVTKADYRRQETLGEISRSERDPAWTPVQSDVAGAYATLLCAAGESNERFMAGLDELHVGLLPRVSSNFLREDELAASQSGDGELAPVAAWIAPDW